MDKLEFKRRFLLAEQAMIQYCRRLTDDPVPDACVYTYQTWGLPIHRDGRFKFIGGRLLTAEQLDRFDTRTAIDYLFVDGLVPAWINLNIEGLWQEKLLIQIRINPRILGSEDAHLRHRREGNPPFHMLGFHGSEYSVRKPLPRVPS